MSSDMKRIRTFLAYKGFQWEPLSPHDRFDTPSMDFKAIWDGQPSIIGTMISLGRERPYGGNPIKISMDAEEKADLRSCLVDQLELAEQRLNGAATGAGLPKVLAVVNHDPNMQFEDLTAVMEDSRDKTPLNIDLLIWFDDFRNDRMLFRRTDAAAYEKLFDWFHVS